MKKQSAVEWFIEKDTRVTIDFLERKITQLELVAKKATFIQQAKVMFEKQMEQAFSESRLTHPMIGFKHESFNDYYNEIYGGDK
jgi:hypothetical protein